MLGYGHWLLFVIHISSFVHIAQNVQVSGGGGALQMAPPNENSLMQVLNILDSKYKYMKLSENMGIGIPG
jgi:hypothetical protein